VNKTGFSSLLDLFVGAWIARTARAEGFAHLLVLPCLVLTYLFGLAGLLVFTALRATVGTRNPLAERSAA